MDNTSQKRAGCADSAQQPTKRQRLPRASKTNHKFIASDACQEEAPKVHQDLVVHSNASLDVLAPSTDSVLSAQLFPADRGVAPQHADAAPTAMVGVEIVVGDSGASSNASVASMLDYASMSMMLSRSARHQYQQHQHQQQHPHQRHEPQRLQRKRQQPQQQQHGAQKVAAAPSASPALVPCTVNAVRTAYDASCYSARRIRATSNLRKRFELLCSTDDDCMAGSQSSSTCTSAQQVSTTFVEAGVLGSGSFATVYRVKDVATGRSYAAKVFNAPESLTAQGYSYVEARQCLFDSFKAEAKALQLLQGHPNVIAYVAHGQCRVSVPESMSPRTSCSGSGHVSSHHTDHASVRNVIIMEEASQTLTDLVARMPLDEALARRYTAQLLRALQAMQSGRLPQGSFLAHRDIKDANILIGKDDQAKLADFGVSVLLQPSYPYSFDSVGTMAYRAPELHSCTHRTAQGPPGQCRHSYQVDCWSIGCVLYVMLTGEQASFSYVGDSDQLQNARKSAQMDVDTHEAYEGLSEGAKDFLKRCFTFDSAQRPSAAQLLEHPYLAGADC